MEAPIAAYAAQPLSKLCTRRDHSQGHPRAMLLIIHGTK